MGALGIPYGRLDRFDATLDLEEPEILFYEPEKDGRLELVGGEVVIPIQLRAGPDKSSSIARDVVAGGLPASRVSPFCGPESPPRPDPEISDPDILVAPIAGNIASGA